MSANPAHRVALQPARVELLEQLVARCYGTRTRWAVRVVLDGAELHRTTGTGPLGRLRARVQALTWCQVHGYQVDEDLAPAQGPRSAAWSYVALMRRLRAEGIMP